MADVMEYRFYVSKVENSREYKATMPAVFPEVCGKGVTPIRAIENLCTDILYFDLERDQDK